MGMPDASSLKTAELQQAMLSINQYSNLMKMYYANMSMQAGYEASSQQPQAAQEIREHSPQAPSTPAINTPTYAGKTECVHASVSA
eukprot:scaffold4005_cov417-Prasinococcus_capsulatus_cf.AAC.3